MNYRELQAKLKEYKKQGFTTIKLNQEYRLLEREYNKITNILKYAPKEWAIRKLRGEQHPTPEPESQVAKTEPETTEPTATQAVDTVAKAVEWVRDYQDDLKGNYRIDENEEDEDGELWLERLEDGEPTENYVSISPAQLEQLKANEQIWKYSREVERWVPPFSNLPHLSISSFRIEVDNSIQPTPEPEQEIVLFNLSQFNVDQIEAIKQAIEYGCKEQVTPYEAFWELSLTETITPEGLRLTKPLDDFIPTTEEKDRLIKGIDDYLAIAQ